MISNQLINPQKMLVITISLILMVQMMLHQSVKLTTVDKFLNTKKDLIYLDISLLFIPMRQKNTLNT